MINEKRRTASWSLLVDSCPIGRSIAAARFLRQERLLCILVIGRTVKFRFSSVAFAGTSLAQMFRSIRFLPVINAYFWNYRLNLVDDNSAA
jgi:hypothetical protein